MAFATLLGHPLGCPWQPRASHPSSVLRRLCTAAHTFCPLPPLPAAGEAHPQPPGCAGVPGQGAQGPGWHGAARAIARLPTAVKEGSRGVGCPLGATGWAQAPTARGGDGVPSTDGASLGALGRRRFWGAAAAGTHRLGCLPPRAGRLSGGLHGTKRAGRAGDSGRRCWLVRTPLMRLPLLWQGWRWTDHALVEMTSLQASEKSRQKRRRGWMGCLDPRGWRWHRVSFGRSARPLGSHGGGSS